MSCKTQVLYRSLLTFIVSAISLTASAAPYTFTPEDYIEYGIYFAERGAERSSKLLTIRYGNIQGYYNEYFPEFTPPTVKQRLRLATSHGTVRVDRNDNVGLTVTRDTYNERRRRGTKRLEVTFQHATCTDAAGITSPCSVNLVLTTDGPDRGVVRERRRLTITTSTGLAFRYRSLRTDGGKPLNLPALNRSPAISNYAWEWRRNT
jgi:hypothetical protein